MPTYHSSPASKYSSPRSSILSIELESLPFHKNSLLLPSNPRGRGCIRSLVYRWRIPLALLTLSIVLVIIHFVTRKEPPPFFSRKITAASEDIPLRSTVSPSFPKDEARRFNGTWDYRRDARNLFLNEEQCGEAFPGLFKEVERAVRDRKDRKVGREELEGGPRDIGYVRGMMWDNQLYIIETAGADSYSRTRATLHALHRAILTSPSALPNIEFVLRPNDIVDPHHVSWSYCRRPADANLWLIPDFGFWAWPETNIGSYAQIQHVDTALDSIWPWEKKQDQLLWRGVERGKQVRTDLLHKTQDKSWADVRALDWKSASSREKYFLSMAEQCRYKYLAYTEGRSYSGRLKYLQNCRGSMIIAHEMEWTTHYQHLMIPSGLDQNYVQAKADWSDLEEKMGKLMENQSWAKKVAENAVRTFPERYLTEAAEVCYWRRLVQGWASVLDFEVELLEEREGEVRARGIPVESWFVLGEYGLDTSIRDKK